LELPPANRLSVEGARDRIFLGIESDRQLTGLDKAKVEVLLSEPKSFVVGFVVKEASDPKVIKKKWLCYVPHPGDFTNIVMDPAMINQKLDYLMKKQIISQEIKDILYDKQIR
jgi:hypothetical protein